MGFKLFKYTGSLVCFSINVDCSSFWLCVCTRDSVHLLGQFLWTVLLFVPILQFRNITQECCCSINWVLIYICSLLPLLQSGNFIPSSVTKAWLTSRTIAISPQAFSIRAPGPCPWWSWCFCSSLS